MPLAPQEREEALSTKKHSIFLFLKAYIREAPDIPAPIMATGPILLRALDLNFILSGGSFLTAKRISFFFPIPLVFETQNPFFCNPRLTYPATVKVDKEPLQFVCLYIS